MNNRKKEKIHRPIIVYLVLLFVFGLLPVRILLIGSEYSAVADDSSSKSLVVAQSRGIIYDRRLRRLTGDSISTVSVVKPTISVLNTLRDVLDKQTLEYAEVEIAHQNPLLLKIGNSVENEDILTVPVYNRYNATALASHIIGYLSDGETKGVSGIEKSFDSFLSGHSGELRARFYTDANGSTLPGTDIELVNNNYNSSAGVVLTIDKKYQTAVENAMDKCGLRKGAAVMLDVKSGEIVAAVSRPDYDRNNISACLTDENLPLFNRVLGAYPVGSVFKPLVAACALEQGTDPTDEYICNGYVVSGGRTFKCMKNHGTVNMASALAFSCNCYFINLIEKLDVSLVLDCAENLGFGSSLELTQDICTYSGNIPELTELEAAAARANFSFGQGSLTANVIQVASLYAAIANGGELNLPYLVKGICDENMSVYDEHSPAAPRKVFTSESANTVRTFLELAVREGTGSAASVKSCLVGGKTASAQSGEYIGEEERIVTWFAGFYPYEEPEYVLVVMCEDGESGSADCAPVFSVAVNELLNNN